MQGFKTNIPEVMLFEPNVFGDERGFFYESFNAQAFSEATGLNVVFVQDNHSKSIKNVLRGLHYQTAHVQGKLVRVTQGEVFDVAVDMRQSSNTFGQWVGEILSAENKRMMWLPAGFAHGFCVISDEADFEYKCTEFYNPNSEVGIMWNDPDIDIDWPISDPIVSDKDNKNFLISEIPNTLIPKYL